MKSGIRAITIKDTLRRNKKILRRGMNIPKKLDKQFPAKLSDSFIERLFEDNKTAEWMIATKINETITYLQAKEEASKKDEIIKAHNKALDYMIEAAYGASKGEGKLTEEQFDKMAMQGFKWAKEDEDARKSNPPEHEDWEEWTEDEKRYGFKIKNHFNKGEMDYIRDNFVSKEKIKREMDKELEELRDTTACTFYDFANDLKESLGLGD